MCVAGWFSPERSAWSPGRALGGGEDETLGLDRTGGAGKGRSGWLRGEAGAARPSDREAAGAGVCAWALVALPPFSGTSRT